MCTFVGYAGFCHNKFGPLLMDGPNRKRARVLSTNWISVRTRSEATGELLPMGSVVLTLLHELAHTISDHYEVKGEGKHGRKFSSHDHGEDFYRHFREILEVAEEYNIFRLPNSCPNKFSIRSLQRFDAIDVDSAIFGGGTVLGERDSRPDQQLRVTMVWNKARKTLLVDSDITEEELTKRSKAKHRAMGAWKIGNFGDLGQDCELELIKK